MAPRKIQFKGIFASLIDILVFFNAKSGGPHKSKNVFSIMLDKNTAELRENICLQSFVEHPFESAFNPKQIVSVDLD